MGLWGKKSEDLDYISHCQRNQETPLKFLRFCMYHWQGGILIHLSPCSLKVVILDTWLHTLASGPHVWAGCLDTCFLGATSSLEKALSPLSWGLQHHSKFPDILLWQFSTHVPNFSVQFWLRGCTKKTLVPWGCDEGRYSPVNISHPEAKLLEKLLDSPRNRRKISCIFNRQQGLFQSDVKLSSQP